MQSMFFRPFTLHHTALKAPPETGGKRRELEKKYRSEFFDSCFFSKPFEKIIDSWSRHLGDKIAPCQPRKEFVAIYVHI